MLEWARGIDEGRVMDYLPDVPKEVLKLPRAYLANVLFTVVGQRYADWVKRKIQERNEKRKSEREMSIAMDPEIMKIFQASTSVSLAKGTSNNCKCI